MLVVLFGAQSFPRSQLRSHEAFARAARGFESYAREQLGAEVHSFFDSPAPWLEQLESLHGVLTKGGHDTLLVYYVGHGLFLKAAGHESYALAVADTKAGVEYRTSLRADFLAEELRASSCKQKVVILDACFAAAAMSHFQSGDYLRRLRPTFESVAGVAVLAAASKDDVARVANDGGCTMFTGALLEVLRDGDDSSASPKLSLRQVATLVEERLAVAGGTRPELHVPNQRGGRVDEAPLFPNRNPATGNEAPRERRPPAVGRAQPSLSWRRQIVSSAVTASVAVVLGYVGQKCGFQLRTDEAGLASSPARVPSGQASGADGATPSLPSGRDEAPQAVATPTSSEPPGTPSAAKAITPSEGRGRVRAQLRDEAPPPPIATEGVHSPPPTITLAPPPASVGSDRDASAEAAGGDGSSLHACCAALRSEAAGLPPPKNAYALAAAAYCDGAVASRKGRAEVVSGIRSALHGGNLPGRCR